MWELGADGLGPYSWAGLGRGCTIADRRIDLHAYLPNYCPSDHPWYADAYRRQSVAILAQVLPLVFLPPVCTYNASTMASLLDRLTKDVRDRAKFLVAQRSARVTDIDLRQQQQADAFINTVLNVGDIDLDVATQVTTEIMNSGVWADDQKAAMSRSIGSANIRVHPRAGGRGRANQDCHSFEDYQANSDWQSYLDKGLSDWATTGVMSQRLYALNIPCPSQKLLKKCASILVACKENPHEVSPVHRKKLADDVQYGVKRLGELKRRPIEHIIQFPASPFDLPEAFLLSVYNHDRPVICPMAVQLELPRLMKETGIKSTHKSLRRGPQEQQSSQLALLPTAGQHQQGSHMQLTQSLLSMLPMLMSMAQRPNMPHGQPGPSTDIDLQFNLGEHSTRASSPSASPSPPSTHRASNPPVLQDSPVTAGVSPSPVPSPNGIGSTSQGSNDTIGDQIAQLESQMQASTAAADKRRAADRKEKNLAEKEEKLRQKQLQEHLISQGLIELALKRPAGTGVPPSKKQATETVPCVQTIASAAEVPPKRLRVTSKSPHPAAPSVDDAPKPPPKPKRTKAKCDSSTPGIVLSASISDELKDMYSKEYCAERGTWKNWRSILNKRTKATCLRHGMTHDDACQAAQDVVARAKTQWDEFKP